MKPLPYQVVRQAQRTTPASKKITVVTFQQSVRSPVVAIQEVPRNLSFLAMQEVLVNLLWLVMSAAQVFIQEFLGIQPVILFPQA